MTVLDLLEYDDVDTAIDAETLLEVVRGDQGEEAQVQALHHLGLDLDEGDEKPGGYE